MFMHEPNQGEIALYGTEKAGLTGEIRDSSIGLYPLPLVAPIGSINRGPSTTAQSNGALDHTDSTHGVRMCALTSCG